MKATGLFSPVRLRLRQGPPLRSKYIVYTAVHVVIGWQDPIKDQQKKKRASGNGIPFHGLRRNPLVDSKHGLREHDSPGG